MCVPGGGLLCVRAPARASACSFARAHILGGLGAGSAEHRLGDTEGRRRMKNARAAGMTGAWRRRCAAQDCQLDAEPAGSSLKSCMGSVRGPRLLLEAVGRRDVADGDHASHVVDDCDDVVLIDYFTACRSEDNDDHEVWVLDAIISKCLNS